MIIERQEDVTTAVLSELARAPNARFKEIMGPFIRHMHDFVRESKLTEEEFRTAMNYVVALGKASNESHNEAVLIAGSLGISSLVCLLNNSDGQTDTDASLLGPFWREQSPVTPNGGSIIRSPTPGPALFVNAWFRDRSGAPIVGTEVDIWQSSTEGFYENLMRKTVEFFRTKESPISIEEQMAAVQVFSAAEESFAKGGVWVDVTK